MKYNFDDNPVLCKYHNLSVDGEELCRVCWLELEEKTPKAWGRFEPNESGIDLSTEEGKKHRWQLARTTPSKREITKDTLVLRHNGLMEWDELDDG